MRGDTVTDVIFLSLKVAAAAMALSLPLALGVALILTRLRFRGQLVLRTLVYLPLVLPPVVTGYLLLLALGPTTPAGRLLAPLVGGGPAFHWTGAAIAASVMAFPLMVRPMALAIDAVDPRLEQSAATLGASRLRILMTVTLPMASTGILAGLALGFAKALGEFGATITFAANIPGETRTIALAVHSALQRTDGDATALLLTAVALAIGTVAVGLSEFAATRITRASRA